MADIKVLPDIEALMTAAADYFVERAREAIAARGRFSVALSGGSTPRALFWLLASDAYRDQVDWERVYVFWGDERCVPPDNAESNYRMAQDALLSRVPILPEHVYRIEGEMEPRQAAINYEARLQGFFGESPRFDLILLGMGDDGHTASLFPGTAAVGERTRWVVTHYVDNVSAWRITLTPLVINAAANVCFVVSGANKADKLLRVMRGEYEPDKLPAQIVKPVNGQLLWLVDQAAGALIATD